MLAYVSILCASVVELMVSLWEHGNERSSMKQRLGKLLSNWATLYFLKKDFAPWNDLFETILIDTSHYVWIREKWKITFDPYTGCNRRNGPDFGRMFLMLNYTEKAQNTYIQSWTVSEIMASEVWNTDSCYTLTDYQIHIETDRNMWFL